MKYTGTPAVGSTVTVEVRNTSAVDRNIFNVPDTIEYTGTVLRSEPHDPQQSFRLTGDHFMPVRVISMSQLVRVGGAEVIVPPTAEKTRTFQVDGSKGSKYVVTIEASGKGKCTCTGFSFHRRCKHIDSVLDQIKGK